MEISVATFVISILASAAIGSVVGIFVYRNNKGGTIGKVADKVDAIHDVIKGEENK